ncbi:MAG: hypothetical protein U5K75_01940 [Ahrensia sp.]|nr:hypothetical protein [Ahrensia sp.]
MNSFRLILATVLMASLIAFVPAAQANERASIISAANQFYASISPGQDAASMQAKMDGLLAPEAQIEVQDLGVTQTRSEFVESLDNWYDAISGGFVAHKIEEAASNNVTVLVCYNFGDNAMTTREILTVEAAMISKAVQTKIADDCTDF